jgi:drug/metabolite transporter superfamily protein YnfA
MASSPPFHPFLRLVVFMQLMSGVFIVLSTLWGWGVDKKTPDLNDWIGAAICLVGVFVIIIPRN